MHQIAVASFVVMRLCYNNQFKCILKGNTSICYKDHRRSHIQLNSHCIMRYNGFISHFELCNMLCGMKGHKGVMLHFLKLSTL